MKWLPVFANVEDWKSMADSWPEISHVKASVIVTCQKPAGLLPWANYEAAVTHFDPSAGAQFLLFLLGINQPDRSQSQIHEARGIASHVGGLPVCLAHINGHIK